MTGAAAGAAGAASATSAAKSAAAESSGSDAGVGTETGCSAAATPFISRSSSLDSFATSPLSRVAASAARVSCFRRILLRRLFVTTSNRQRAQQAAVLHQPRPLQWQRKISRCVRGGPQASINALAPTAAAAAAISTAGIDVAPGANTAGRVHLHLRHRRSPASGRRRSLAKPKAGGRTRPAARGAQERSMRPVRTFSAQNWT